MAGMNTEAPGGTLPGIATLRLWQLISPALPIGAFAYSQGLEWAVSSGAVGNQQQALDWLRGILIHNLCRCDLPLLQRLYRAWRDADAARIDYWNAWLLACRGSAELRAEDCHQGKALARLLANLQVEAARPWAQRDDATFAAVYALALHHWQIELAAGACGLLWSWCENQVGAAIKLIPLGQSAGQQLLSELLTLIPDQAAQALGLDDDAMGNGLPGQVMASMRHETQYSRLFRS